MTVGQLQGPHWRRVLHGVYADARLPDDHRTRCLAAVLAMPGTVVAGRSAAALHGARCARRSGDPVEVAAPAGSTVRRRRGVVVRRVDLADTDVAAVDGVPVTARLRTAGDVAATLPLEESVPILDEMLRLRLVEHTRLRAAVALRAGRPGAARARRAVSLADGRAQSPPESTVRLALTLAGTSPVPQVTIEDASGRFVARVDLAYPDDRVAVEYDGSYHAAPGQLTKDRARLNRLQSSGWTVVFVTAPDLRDLAAVVDRVRGALTRARHSRP